MLNRHAPLIRVMTFMGQASAGKGVKGFTQKEQLEVKTGFLGFICITLGDKVDSKLCWAFIDAVDQLFHQPLCRRFNQGWIFSY